jgi:hypothetical protein
MTDFDPPHAVCPTSGLRLYAVVEADGSVSSIQSFEDGAEPDGNPYPQRHRHLPLYGEDTPFDLVTEVRSPPVYRVEADRVTRSYTVRAKTAAELLREISWWFGATAASENAAHFHGAVAR